MPVLRIENGRTNGSGLAIGYDTRTFLDGVEVRDVRDIKLHIGLDEAVKATIEVYVVEPFEYEAPVDVTVVVNGPAMKLRNLLFEAERLMTHQHGECRFPSLPCVCGVEDWRRRLDETMKAERPRREEDR